MVAGATGIDLFLLVVDAGEGARPQTHEHLAILRLLGVEQGVVAVTKADAVDAETLELALEEARELVPGAQVVAVSGETGAGLDELRARSGRGRRRRSTPRAADFPARLFVDRVFTLRGIGTVVTGTLWSGSIARGRRLARARRPGRAGPLRPGARQPGRARRGRPARRPRLPGVERRDVRRGDALVAAGRLPVLVPPRRRARGARADRGRRAAHGAPRDEPHRGTRRPHRRRARAAPARSPGRRRARRSRRAARRDDRRRRRRPRPGAAARVDAERDRLSTADDPASIVRALVHAPVSVDALAARALLDGAELEEGLDAVRVDGRLGVLGRWLEETGAAVEERLREQAERSPLDPGARARRASPVRALGRDVLALLPVERRGPKAYLPGRGREPR